MPARLDRSGPGSARTLMPPRSDGHRHQSADNALSLCTPEEVVVKRFCRTGPNTVELQPASNNPEHKPIRITPSTVGFEVVGTVVGAIVGTRRDPAD